MASHKCAFCNQIFALNQTTYKEVFMNFTSGSFPKQDGINYPGLVKAPGGCVLKFFKCPNDECNIVSIFFEGNDSFNFQSDKWIFPDYRVSELPNYVPESIRRDFNEACRILELSPKASATLSRRALQSMIRDFHRVVNQPNLHQEILSIRDRIDADEFDALMALKSIGNIGAHSEKNINVLIDVDPVEARQLIELIELFVDEWYTKREQRKLKLERVKEIGNKKQDEKLNSTTTTTSEDQQ